MIHKTVFFIFIFGRDSQCLAQVFLMPAEWAGFSADHPAAHQVTVIPARCKKNILFPAAAGIDNKALRYIDPKFGSGQKREPFIQNDTV